MLRIDHPCIEPLQAHQAGMQFLFVLDKRRARRLALIGQRIAGKELPIGSQYGNRSFRMPRGSDGPFSVERQTLDTRWTTQLITILG
jgi:hypothetical protein